jgi:hypothetical protein
MGREPAYLELFGVSELPAEDESVMVEEPGRFVYTCRVLDHTNVCAVVEARDIRPFHSADGAGTDPDVEEGVTTPE